MPIKGKKRVQKSDKENITKTIKKWLRKFDKKRKLNLEKIKNWLHKNDSLIRRNLASFKKTLIFHLYLWRLISLNFLRYRIIPWFSLKKYILGTIIYFLVLTIFVIYLGRFMDAYLPKSDAIAFFTSSAAMVGGILAIVLSLSMLLMGNAAERIPVGFYETAARDGWHDLIFIFISFCSLCIFAFSLTFGRFHLGFATLSFQVTLALLGAVFYLIFIFYQRVRERLNPTNVLKIARKQALDKLESTNKRAREIAEVLIRQPKLNKTVTKEQAIATSFQYLQPEFSYITSRLNYLFDYHDKLVSTNERSSALQVLQSITIILQKYFETRKESSLVLPAGVFLATTSDSQSFLTQPLERLVSVGENYMRNNDNAGITNIISIFVQLCQSASEVKYLTNIPGENPIMEQCRGYLDQLLQSAIRFNYQEALFQGPIAYSKIASIAIKNKFPYHFFSIYENLDKIAINALTNKFDVVLGEVINAYNSILTELIIAKSHNLEIELGSLFEHLRNIILLFYFSVSTGTIENNFISQTNLALPFDNLSSLIFQVAKAGSEADKDEDRKEWQSVFIIVVEELRSTLRYLSERMKTADHILINTFGDIISDIGVLLLDLSQDEKWKENKKELIDQVGWYIHQPEWFTHEVDKINSNLHFDSLVEAVAKIGLRALQINQDYTAKDAIEIISKFANEMLTKEEGRSYGFTEPRIMERACFIGIFALKQAKQEMIGQLKKNIKSFEEAYVKKWLSNLPEGVKLTSPREDQLLMEVQNLINEIGNRFNRPRLMDRSEDIIIQLVTEEDVKKFIKEIWEVEIKNNGGGSSLFL